MEFTLNPEHPVGGARARRYATYGFTRETADDFVEQVRRLVEAGYPVGPPVEEYEGMKYIFEGEIFAPIGVWMRIRVVFLLRWGSKKPQYITSYPL